MLFYLSSHYHDIATGTIFMHTINTFTQFNTWNIIKRSYMFVNMTQISKRNNMITNHCHGNILVWIDLIAAYNTNHMTRAKNHPTDSVA